MTDQARGAGHTNGPWKVVVYGAGVSLVIHSDAENRVCFMATPGDKSSFKTIKANARLIAAAPDLLAALELIASSETTLDRCAIARRVLIDKGLASWLPTKAKGEA